MGEMNERKRVPARDDAEQQSDTEQQSDVGAPPACGGEERRL
jgi:hypothetical protein